MAELFGCSSDNISLHLKNIFEAGELEKDSVTEKISATAADGKNYPTNFYNLDAIISVGYRVNSIQATHFRIWATKVLKEYIQKGFVLDDERLKQGKDAFGKDYFRELLERVRSIRASERRIYQQITDIFAECSIDYDKDSQITQDFYATVQNKFHYAITGQTAAEIIYTKADPKQPRTESHLLHLLAIISEIASKCCTISAFSCSRKQVFVVMLKDKLKYITGKHNLIELNKPILDKTKYDELLGEFTYMRKL